MLRYLQTRAPGKALVSHPSCGLGLCEHWAPQILNPFVGMWIAADRTLSPLLQPCLYLKGFQLTLSTPGASVCPEM